jgi:large subunit ribosomal protein L30
VSDKKLKITLVRSINHRSKSHSLMLQALGLRKIRQVVERPDNPAVRGLVKKLDYLLCVEEAQ